MQLGNAKNLRAATELSRSTLADWVGQVFRPLGIALENYLMAGTDDTTVPVLQPGCYAGGLCSRRSVFT